MVNNQHQLHQKVIVIFHVWVVIYCVDISINQSENLLYFNRSQSIRKNNFVRPDCSFFKDFPVSFRYNMKFSHLDFRKFNISVVVRHIGFSQIFKMVTTPKTIFLLIHIWMSWTFEENERRVRTTYQNLFTWSVPFKKRNHEKCYFLISFTHTFFSPIPETELTREDNEFEISVIKNHIVKSYDDMTEVTYIYINEC